ncbi:MAG: hypothetical protein ABJB65_02985 [Chloroflexota bacterium]
MQDRSRALHRLPDGPDQGAHRAVNAHHLTALLARWKNGSDEAAAAYLGMSRHTLKNLLYDLRTQIGARDTTQATYLLRDALIRLDEAPEGA